MKQAGTNLFGRVDQLSFAGHFLETPLTLVTEKPQTELDPLSIVSLQHCGTLRINLSNANECYRIVRRIPQGKWTAVRLEKGRLSANFQGNPTWPAQILNKYCSLSRWLGLSGSFNDNYCIFPLPKTVNSAIQTIFQGLGYDSSSLFGFSIDEAGDSEISDRKYVDGFIDQRKIPMANIHNRDSVHDWSYHFLTLLFPEYLENIRLNLELIRDHLNKFGGLTCYSWNYYGHCIDDDGKMRGTTKTERLPHDKAIYRQMAIALDVSTAKIIQLVKISSLNLLVKCEGELAAFHDYFHGISPAAIDRILWQERNWRACFMPGDRHGHSIDITVSDPLKYVWCRLKELDRAASLVENVAIGKARESVFTEVMSRLQNKWNDGK